MSDIISLILVMAAFGFIAYPILFRRPSPAAPASDDRLRELYSKRDTTYSMLKELEFDHGSGILTDEDYQDLESRYKRKAVAILKGIDDQKASQDDLEATLEKDVEVMRKSSEISNTEAEVEVEIERLRQRGRRPGKEGVKAADLDAELERQVQGLRSRGTLRKSGDGTAGPGVKPQRQVPGVRQQVGVVYCHQCGVRGEQGDRFCSGCGTKLREA